MTSLLEKQTLVAVCSGAQASCNLGVKFVPQQRSDGGGGGGGQWGVGWLVKALLPVCNRCNCVSAKPVLNCSAFNLFSSLQNTFSVQLCGMEMNQNGF